MITLTAQERDALIADCKDEINVLEDRIERCQRFGVPCESYKSDLKRQQIALASLEAEPVAYVHPAYLQVGALGFDASIGRLAPAQVELYTAPPVAVMQPVVLPVMQVDNPLDGFFYRCDEVIAAIRAAGGSVKE